MKNKKRIMFSCFAIIVLVVFAVVLVLVSNKNGNKELEPKPASEQYATSFSLSTPSAIQLLVGTQAKLRTGYLTVEPESVKEKLTFEISQKDVGVVTGLQFANDTISAISVGEYEIKFSVPKSKQTYFTKELKVVVYEEKENSHIYQTRNEITINTEYDLNSIFCVVSNNNFSVETNLNIEIDEENNKLTGLSVCTTNIKFTFDENFVQYIYNFDIEIKDQPQYEIELIGVENNKVEIVLSENNILTIQYVITDNQSGNVSQRVLLSSSNEEVAIAERSMDQFIKITANKEGETIITIVMQDNQSIETSLLVIVKQ